ncbi:hypothetical protein [Paraburkholderia hospita]|uniref:hypothetical protein n=1 Tax=Paraburkholderia hospita TaxID=169430 RepID=UPI000B342F62|nr:hypothetical protein [Paraburkholderia hospita]OUL76766.1 hypothetical protein CA603_37500 [Paraburkholderia hospita]
MPDLAIPIAFPEYKAHSDEINKDVPSGHAGILFVDARSGITNYYEYGRYDPARRGLVQSKHIANAVRSGGTVTVHSLKKAFKDISHHAGHGGRLRAAWIEVADGGFDNMRTFCLSGVQANQNPQRKAYDEVSNNCCTFARAVADAGGAAIPFAVPLAYQAAAALSVPIWGNILFLVSASPIPNPFLTQLLTIYPGLEFKPPNTWTSAGLRPLEVN